MTESPAQEAAESGQHAGSRSDPAGQAGRGEAAATTDTAPPTHSTSADRSLITDRAHIPAARNVVVKVGSSSLTDPSGHLVPERLTAIARVISDLHERGVQAVLVSSGAIAAALGELGLEQRPTAIPAQQAAASVGQVLLARAWADAFGPHRITTAQVLLTENDLAGRDTYVNARSALNSLLSLGVLPVINENDATATAEIRFGDNDRLAALVAQLLGADLLVMLTDVDALYTAPPREPGATRIAEVPDIEALRDVSIGDVGSRVGTGGMVTKLAAAHLAVSTGTATMLTTLQDFAPVLAGEDRGTFFPAHLRHSSSRMVWLRFATKGAGTVRVDAGAAQALRTGRRSLLAIGVTEVRGSFPSGVPVDVQGPDGSVIARGLAGYASEDLRAMAGRSSEDVVRERGSEFKKPVIHRDHLVLL